MRKREKKKGYEREMEFVCFERDFFIELGLMGNDQKVHF